MDFCGHIHTNPSTPIFTIIHTPEGVIYVCQQCADLCASVVADIRSIPVGGFIHHDAQRGVV